jgi:hypothetical protein
MLRGQNTKFLVVKRGGLYSYHYALKGVLPMLFDRQKKFRSCSSGLKLRAGYSNHDIPRCRWIIMESTNQFHDLDSWNLKDVS